jgi:hypothetical protein
VSVYGPVFDNADALRDALVIGFAARETAGGPDAPTRVFINEGVPADDCEQLIIYMEAMRSGVTLDGGFERNALDAATVSLVIVDYAARIVRCAAQVGPQGQAPSAAVAEANAQAILSDADVLMTTVLQAVDAGTLWGLCDGVSKPTVTPIQAQGMVVGNLLRVSVQL